jgi:hypothetical protein
MSVSVPVPVLVQPKTYLPGQPGQARSLMLELKLIADVGLVGFPNVSGCWLHMHLFWYNDWSLLYIAGFNYN